MFEIVKEHLQDTKLFLQNERFYPKKTKSTYIFLPVIGHDEMSHFFVVKRLGILDAMMP